MAISSFSKFYFGTEIILNGASIDINEGSGELSGELDLGIYSLTGLAAELQQVLNAIGALNYVVTFNRDTRIFTITADGAFDILINTGTNASSGAYGVFGFTGSSDLTGLFTYTGSDAAGSEYITQFPPQNYVAPGFRKEKADASINQSASGRVEVISFGDVEFIEMDLLYITDLPMDGKVIGNNPNGTQDAIDFLTFATNRGPIEFMPDKDDTSTFYEVILDKTAGDKKATKFKLREETGRRLPNIYRSGMLDFRILE